MKCDVDRLVVACIHVLTLADTRLSVSWLMKKDKEQRVQS